MSKVKIIYTGPVLDEVRQGMDIMRLFVPQNSYVDSPVFTQGYPNDQQVGDKEAYGKSIYATNVAGFGELPGLMPLASSPIRFALYEQAKILALKAKCEGSENKGIEIEVEGYQEELYWNQMAPNFVSQGFYTEVGENKYGIAPADSDVDDDIDDIGG